MTLASSWAFSGSISLATAHVKPRRTDWESLKVYKKQIRGGTEDFSDDHQWWSPVYNHKPPHSLRLSKLHPDNIVSLDFSGRSRSHHCLHKHNLEIVLEVELQGQILHPKRYCCTEAQDQMCFLHMSHIKTETEPYRSSSQQTVSWPGKNWCCESSMTHQIYCSSRYVSRLSSFFISDTRTDKKTCQSH